MKFRPIYYNTDNGYFIENIKKSSFYIYIGYDMQISTVDLKEDLPKIGQVNFVLDDFSTTYNRSYIKLQEVMANIGGVMKFLLF